MSVGFSYTTPLLSITNAMLAGSIALSKLDSGTIGQIIVVNALGNAIYGSLTLNNLQKIIYHLEQLINFYKPAEVIILGLHYQAMLLYLLGF